MPGHLTFCMSGMYASIETTDLPEDVDDYEAFILDLITEMERLKFSRLLCCTQVECSFDQKPVRISGKFGASKAIKIKSSKTSHDAMHVLLVNQSGIGRLRYSY